MKKYVFIGFGVIAALIVAAIFVFVFSQEDSKHIEPSDFFGEWVATEYIPTNNIQLTTFYPEKYLGNRIVLEADICYSEHMGNDFDSSIYEYSIEEVSYYDLWVWYKVFFFELGIESDTAPVLFRYNEPRYDFIVGVIRNSEELICNTGTGWYVYKRAEK